MFGKLMEHLKEAVLELLRLAALYLVSYLLTEGVTAMLLEQHLGMYLTPVQRMYVTGAITGLLRSLDKWLHEIGKDRSIPGFNLKGLLPF